MQMKKIALIAAAIGMTFGVASVSAAELANEFQGQLAAGSSKVDGGDSSSFGFGQVSYGRFFSPSLEGVVSVNYMAADDADRTGISVGVNYFFTPIGKAGNAAWYVGADVGGSSGSGEDETTWSGKVGLKYFLTDSAAIDVTFMHQEMKPKDSKKTQLDLLLIGASTFF